MHIRPAGPRPTVNALASTARRRSSRSTSAASAHIRRRSDSRRPPASRTSTCPSRRRPVPAPRACRSSGRCPWTGAHPPIGVAGVVDPRGCAGVKARAPASSNVPVRSTITSTGTLAEHAHASVGADGHVRRPGDGLARSEVHVRHDRHRSAARIRRHVPRRWAAGRGQVHDTRPLRQERHRDDRRRPERARVEESLRPRGVKRAPSGTNAPCRSTTRSDSADEYTQNVAAADNGTTANAPARAAPRVVGARHDRPRGPQRTPVRYPAAAGVALVRLTATAVAPGGTRPTGRARACRRPAAGHRRVWRVSRMRAGASGSYSLGHPAATGSAASPPTRLAAASCA